MGGVRVTNVGQSNTQRYTAIRALRTFGKESDKFLEKEFTYSDGYRRKIDKAFIHSGGHSTQMVYKFCSTVAFSIPIEKAATEYRVVPLDQSDHPGCQFANH